MASNRDLAIQYTDDIYATRLEIAKAIGTNIIDPIWASVLSYRREFAHELSLHDINKAPYYVVLTNPLLQKTALIESRFANIQNKYDAMEEGSIERETFRRDMFRAELKYLAKAKSIIINDVALDNIIQDSNTNLLYEPLINYFNCLKDFENLTNEPIDESLLAHYLEILNGGGELVSFYRTNEISVPSQRVLINREYAAAPTSQIETMMNELFAFINQSNTHFPIKIAIISYMFNYVKPFESFNEELCLLLMKHVLASNDLDASPAVVPLELLFWSSKDALANASREVQKTRDVTYYVNESYRLYDEALSLAGDRIVQVTRDALARDYYGSEPEPAPAPIKEEVRQETSEEPRYTYNPEIPSYERRVEPAPVKDEAKPIPQPARPQPKVAPVANNEPAVNVRQFADLDEKALNRAAEDLLESDPNLRPSQAHFYVRHCTLGKYYTIQQFKKAEGCVYETARTSMDNLARRGYYRREQVKNKFVYTPISKE